MNGPNFFQHEPANPSGACHFTAEGIVAPIRIALKSPISTLAYAMAARLEQDLAARVTVHLEDSGFGVSHRPELPAAVVSRLLSSLNPFRLEVEHPLPPDTEAASDMIVRLGWGGGAPLPSIRWFSPTPDFGRSLLQPLADLGFNTLFQGKMCYDFNIMVFGNHLHPFTRGILPWVLRQQGIEVAVFSEDMRDDHEVALILADPTATSADDLFDLELRCDDPSVALDWADRGLAGYRTASGRKFPKPMFLLDLGPLAIPRFHLARLALERALLERLTALGVDPHAHPLRIRAKKKKALEPYRARVVAHLPIAAWKAGRLRPYAKEHPERFDVIVRTDEPASCADFVAELRANGYRVIEEPIASVAQAQSGFAIAWGSAARSARHQMQIKHLSLALDKKIRAPFSLKHQQDADSGPNVHIHLPFALAASGRLDHLAGKGFDLRIHFFKSKDGWEELIAALRAMGFNQTEVREGFEPDLPSSGNNHLEFGGAPLRLVEYIQSLVQKEGIPDLILDKRWPDMDNDLWVFLREHPKMVEASSVATQGAIQGTNRWTTDDAAATLAASDLWVEPEDWNAVVPLRLVDGSTVTLGEWALPRRSDVPAACPWAPDPPADGYCLDAPTLATLEFLAGAVALREPALLEGYTATSKTSAVLYLAALLGQPVLRLNLNGMTDTQELIGKPWPAEGGGWRWQDGAAPIALREGYWLLLDEVNLAPPQILERLNSLLERQPTLMMSEHDGRRIAGTAAHPAFRVFATMNPAEFSGRNLLSPAWRDRFLAYRHCPVAGEREYWELLTYLIYGEQPAVRWRQAWVQAEASASPPFADLRALPQLRWRLRNWARFHASMTHLTGQDGARSAQLAVRRKEKPVFSRRGLGAALGYLQRCIQDNPAWTAAPEALFARLLERYYLSRMASAEDRDTVRQLAVATELGAVAMVAPETAMEVPG
ncbi:MAG: hypothetical protein EA420_09005 [Candidatus Competibacteraceae bacterium]|nr:MAG: hypothetical protein EA420_09005 [Candidatus Competibacteraceae bacterium]